MRKHILFVLSSLIIASLALGACGAPSEPIVGESPVDVVSEPVTEDADPKDAATAPTEPVSMYRQSPFLDDKGLPPVEERLPENPMVIAPLAGNDQQYGGNLRIGFTGGSPSWGGVFYITQWEGLVQWTPDFSGVEPALLEELEVNAEATEYIFHIRKGLKWSDGDPYDADDIMFFIDDVCFNTELNPGGCNVDWLPTDLRDGFAAEKIDSHTVKFTFPAPYGTFPYSLASWAGRYFAYYPKHHLVQFHADYNQDIDALIATEEGVEDWVALFNKLGPDGWANPDRFFERPEMPVMGPFVTKQPLGTGSIILMERNPYYWKMDPNGNQLPYIDQLTVIQYQDEEARTLAMLNGDLDHIGSAPAESRVLYHDAVDEGKPLVIKYPQGTNSNTLNIHFNRTHADPVKAELFANKDFRIGMSHAINRLELIEIVFDGQGSPAQPSPLEGSPLYNEQLTKQYTEYDVNLANQYLDKVIPDKGTDGFRLGSDGKPLEIVMFVPNDLSYGTAYEQIGELLSSYWQAVGVKVLMNSMPDSQYGLAKEENLIEIAMFASGDGAGIATILAPRDVLPMEAHSQYGNGWYFWRVNQANTVHVEPPQWVKDLYSKYTADVLGGATEEDQIAAMNEIIQVAADEFWVVGISRLGPTYLPFNARMGGIPETWYAGWTPGNQKIYRPEQWYLTD